MKWFPTTRTSVIPAVQKTFLIGRAQSDHVAASNSQSSTARAAKRGQSAARARPASGQGAGDYGQSALQNLPLVQVVICSVRGRIIIAFI